MTRPTRDRPPAERAIIYALSAVVLAVGAAIVLAPAVWLVVVLYRWVL